MKIKPAIESALKNKFAISTGIILAIVDFILIGGHIASYCVNSNPRCGEEMMLAIFNYPTLAIFQPILFTTNIIFLDVSLIIISGIIQYFLIGYWVGLMISKIFKKNSIKTNDGKPPVPPN